MSTVFVSRYMPCEDCGASVDRTAPEPHRCSPERRADYQMFALREDVARFGARLRAYLDSPRGRFEVWLAARDVRRGR
jgi:hypothetical protein